MQQSLPWLTLLSSLPEEAIIKLHARFEGMTISMEDIKNLTSRVERYCAFAREKKLYQWIAHYGMEVRHENFAYDFLDLLYRAELNVEEKRIVIFQPLLDELKSALSGTRHLPEIGCDLEEIIIAHEFFHYLEYAFGVKEKEPLLFREIRAHLFTKGYLTLRFYPWILDLLQTACRKPGLEARLLPLLS